jgi:hypothetical protein
VAALLKVKGSEGAEKMNMGMEEGGEKSGMGGMDGAG